MMINIFPSGVAAGDAFCNRVLERQQLKQYIQARKHTVLTAPRRYGKTSLVTQVVQENAFNYQWVDFLSITTRAEVEEKIRVAARALLIQLAPEIKKLHMQTVEKVKAMSPELNLSAMGQSLKLNLATANETPIDALLVELDDYAQRVNKTAVLVFDEFQQISEISEHHAVEALIRHAVERSKAMTYIFSGSNRHLLQAMFAQSERPLYRLCHMMPLNRIHSTSYKPFIQQAAQKQWGVELADSVVEVILSLTEKHSFYVNVLCSELWLSNQAPDSVSWVESTWQRYVFQHKGVIVSDMLGLPLNQKKIIRLLAQQAVNEPYGVAFAMKLNLSTASIRRALEALLGKDLVFKDEQGYYRLLDPALSYYLREC